MRFSAISLLFRGLSLSIFLTPVMPIMASPVTPLICLDLLQVHSPTDQRSNFPGVGLLDSFAPGKAATRSRIKYLDFKLLLSKATDGMRLTPRQESFVYLWYLIVNPRNLTFDPPNPNHNKLTGQHQTDGNVKSNTAFVGPMIRNLAEQIIGMIGHPSELVPEDLGSLQALTQKTVKMLSAPDAHKNILLTKFFNGGMLRTYEYMKTNKHFVKSLRSHSETDLQRYMMPERGIEISEKMSGEPAFKQLRSVDSDFANKVIWLKQKTTDLENFNFSLNALFDEIDLRYKRSLAATKSQRKNYPEEFQNILKGVLLRRAYQSAIETIVKRLGLNSTNLDEIYGVGRVDGDTFASELFPNGYIFWDRGLSSLSGLGPGHGSDLHIVQSVLYGMEMDREFGAGTFAKFYRKIGRPDVYRGPQDVRIFYEYGWIQLFDDVDSLPGGKNYSNAFSVSTLITVLFQNLFPLVVD
jgi:hypothetical protein